MHDLQGNRIAEYEYDLSTYATTLLREYIWMDGRAVAIVENGALYFVRTDHIGRSAFATNDLGVKVWEATHLPFGGVHASTGNPTDLRFPGQWFQSESGLHQNWMRDYDPTTGRHVKADPLGLVDGASVYGYALQNPARYVDPTGEFTLKEAKNSLQRKNTKAGSRRISTLDEIFDEWLRLEKASAKWTENIPECSCNQDDIDYTIWYELKKADQYYHPGAVMGTRSRPTPNGHGGQCMYDTYGNLILKSPAAGSADYYSPTSLGTAYRHSAHDVKPWEAA